MDTIDEDKLNSEFLHCFAKIRKFVQVAQLRVNDFTKKALRLEGSIYNRKSLPKNLPMSTMF